MAKKTRSQLTSEIEDLCDRHGCGEKIAKIHLAQYVDRNWQPHPSREFELWWKTEPQFSDGIDAKRAFNCQVFRDRFLEAKSVGLVSNVTQFKRVSSGALDAAPAFQKESMTQGKGVN